MTTRRFAAGDIVQWRCPSQRCPVIVRARVIGRSGEDIYMIRDARGSLNVRGAELVLVPEPSIVETWRDLARALASGELPPVSA